jgi:ribosome-binding factor A
MPGDSGRRGHKDLQLCRQVQETLGLALSELNDPILDELILEAVNPAPSAARVEVLLVPINDRVDVEAAKARLDEVAGELRAEVAAEVSRRKVPELVFRIVPRVT